MPYRHQGGVHYEVIGLSCPVCDGELVVTITRQAGRDWRRLWCQRAIGEAHYDRNWQRNIFPPEARHTRVEYFPGDREIALQIQAWEWRHMEGSAA